MFERINHLTGKSHRYVLSEFTTDRSTLLYGTTYTTNVRAIPDAAFAAVYRRRANFSVPLQGCIDNILCLLEHASMSVVPAPFRGLPYLKDTTSFFQELCDVMLLISTGEELPAHAAYLAAYSTVFAGILEAHYASSTHDKRIARIPLPDCSLQEAQIFLCFLYRMRSEAKLCPKSARAVVKVAHKFDVRVALEQCDSFLAQQAALNIRTNSLWVRQASLNPSVPVSAARLLCCM